jgi:hypothetical protein
MPRRRVSISTVAFCGSLVVHAAIVFAAARTFVRQFDHIRLAGFVSGELPATVQPTVPVLVPRPEPDDTALGDQNGTGDSISPSEGDLPLEAPKAEQSQLFLSRDPVGPGEVGTPPSMSVLPQGGGQMLGDVEAAGAPQMIGVPDQSEQIVPAKVAPKSARVAPQDQVPDHRDDVDSTVVQAAPASHDVVTVMSDAAAAQSLPAEAGTPAARAGAPAPPADPAPMSDSEIDPFSSKVGSIRYRAGKAEVQLGRKYRLAPRPQLSLAGKTALLQLPSPITLVLRLHLDAIGNVTRVDIAKSSGSPDVDQPCKVAAYQWWLEPTRDKAGHPIADVVPFVIRFD